MGEEKGLLGVKSSQGQTNSSREEDSEKAKADYELRPVSQRVFTSQATFLRS